MKTVVLHIFWLAGLTTVLGVQVELVPGPARPATIYRGPRGGVPYGVMPGPAAPVAPSKNLLPPAALEVVTQHDAKTAEIRKEAGKKIRDMRLELGAILKELQEHYTQESKLDEAVAIRNCIRSLGPLEPQAYPDPGSLTRYHNCVDRVGFFRVTGADGGSIWGTDVYTIDSSLAVAAVHSGALKLGETGIVKVTILAGQASYQGSTRNGITSSSWPSYPASYKIEAVREEDAQDLEALSDLPLLPGPTTTGEGPTPAAISTAGLPADARQPVERFQRASSLIQEEADQKLKVVRRAIIVELKPLMTNYAKQVKLDEAVAIRDYIRALSEQGSKVLPDPGALYSLPQSRGTFYFRVTGQSGGTVWGTDIYTSDSRLATAAVHAGVLKEGQTGVVKVTILPGQESYEGTTRHGITTHPYGSYSGSYKVEAVPDDESPEG